MIYVCDNCKENCQYKNKNPFSCENSNRKIRKLENDRFKYENIKKRGKNAEYWRS